MEQGNLPPTAWPGHMWLSWGTLLLSPISPLQDLSLAVWVSEGRSAWPLHMLSFGLLLCGHLSRLPNIRTLNSEIAQLSAVEWSD